MVVLCCIVVVTGFLPFLVSRSSLSSPPSQVYYKYMAPTYVADFQVSTRSQLLGVWGSILRLSWVPASSEKMG